MTDDTEEKEIEKVGKKVENETEFLELASKRLKYEIDGDNHNRIAAVEDLKFLNGDQWDPKEEERRKLRGRPCLKMDQLRKYVKQLVGDMRHNRARIKVRPASSDAKAAIATIRQGTIEEIEYLSNAEAIYDYAGECEASCGYGAWRILTRYCDDDPFLQEIYMERIKNPFLVYMDTNAKSEVYADAKYGFVLEKVTREEFEERFPGKEVPASQPVKTGPGVGQGQWYQDDCFFIADYYVLESEEKTICLLEDRSTIEKLELDKKIEEWKAEQEKARVMAAQQQQVAAQAAIVQGRMPPVPPPIPLPVLPPSLKVIKERKVDAPRVRHYAITANQILDGPNDIPGKYIPVVLVQGPDINIEGKRFISSLIRNAKDPQRLLNFWVTDAAEIIDNMPKTPWIGTAKQFEGYEQDYAAANVENFPFLKYNQDTDDKGVPVPPPHRVELGQVPVAVFQQIGQAKQAISDAIGMYKSDVGDQGPERTGAAIRERQKPGDVATFVFIDNLNRSVAHSGKVINEMIPEVYDTDRDVPIKLQDESESFMPVNATVQTALDRVQKNPANYAVNVPELQKLAGQNSRASYNDLKEGTYDVEIHTGPNYATQRAETAAMLMQLIQAAPSEIKIIGHALYGHMDFEGAEEIARLYERGLPPGSIPPKPGEQPVPPLPPPPQMVVKMKELEVKQTHLQLEHEKINLAREKIKIEQIKAVKELQETKGEVRKMMLELLKEILAPEDIGRRGIAMNQTGGMPDFQGG